MSSVNPERVACRMLREYLLRYAPSKTATLNGQRYATIKSATPGPWAIDPGTTITLSTVRGGAGTVVTLPDGAEVTATAIAFAINSAGLGISASGSTGSLVMQGAPSSNAPSVIEVVQSGWNSIFGWPIDGCHDVVGKITPPTWKSIMDGWPVGIPDAKTMSIIIGDRDSTPIGGFRRDEYLVTADLAIWNIDAAVTGHRSRESIQACVQCVREVLESDEGRRLGDETGVIQHVSIGRVRVRGMPFSAFDESKRLIGPPSDVATMQIQMKVFARPDAAP